MEFQKNMLALGLIAGLTACGQDKQASNSRRGQGADLTQALDCREAEAVAKKATPEKDDTKSSDRAAKDEKKDTEAAALTQSEDEEAEESDASDSDDETPSDSDDENPSDSDPEARHVPAASLRLTIKKRATSLCDVMRGKDKKLALFSFASQACEDCLERVKALNESITSQGVDSDVLSVVILSKVDEEPTTKEWNELKEEHAPDAMWGLDKTGEVWKFFAGPKGGGKGVQPWVLAMDVYATGFIDKDADHDLDYLLGQANELLGLEFENRTPEPTGTSEATSTRTETKTGTRTSTSTASRTSSATTTSTVTRTTTGTGTVTATSAATSSNTATRTSTAVARP